MEKQVELKKLATLTFDRNVGTPDRIFRLLSGGALMGAGWYLGLPLSASIVMSVFGLMWLATGVLSRCSIYYLFGYSTCPVSGRSFDKSP
jgi:uncharacterized membrane protein HdeD (DUF308 family)